MCEPAIHTQHSWDLTALSLNFSKSVSHLYSANSYTDSSVVAPGFCEEKVDGAHVRYCYYYSRRFYVLPDRWLCHYPPVLLVLIL